MIKAYLHCLRERMHRIRFAVGALVTQVLAVEWLSERSKMACNISPEQPSHRSWEVFMERTSFTAGPFERAEATFCRIEGVQQRIVGNAGEWVLSPIERRGDAVSGG
jgi:hypothetical protein